MRFEFDDSMTIREIIEAHWATAQYNDTRNPSAPFNKMFMRDNNVRTFIELINDIKNVEPEWERKLHRISEMVRSYSNKTIAGLIAKDHALIIWLIDLVKDLKDRRINQKIAVEIITYLWGYTNSRQMSLFAATVKESEQFYVKFLSLYDSDPFVFRNILNGAMLDVANAILRLIL